MIEVGRPTCADAFVLFFFFVLGRRSSTMCIFWIHIVNMKTFKADYVTQSEFMKREGTREKERMKNIFLESDYKHILSISDDYII